MIVWKKKTKVFKFHYFIEDFNPFIKQCYLLVGTCWKNTESKNPKVVKTKKGRTMLLSKCAVDDGRNPGFIKQPEISELLTSALGVKSPFQEVSMLSSTI